MPRDPRRGGRRRRGPPRPGGAPRGGRLSGPRRRVPLALVEDGAHADDVLGRLLREAKVSVWIATANVKDVRVPAPVGTRDRARGRWTTLLGRLHDLARAGVDVRILHGGSPSRPFQETARALAGGPAPTLAHCPRVHLKLVLVDGAWGYFGSANLTGAGLGGKGEGRRNFELGAIVDDDVLLDRLQERFDRIFRGAECAGCAMRSLCPRPLDGNGRDPAPAGRRGRPRRAPKEP